MENASKALLIAGGVLIAIIITSVFVYMYNEARELPKTQEQIKEAEELAAFNKKYETYARDNIKGTDVITVANMAISNNDKYAGEPDYQITVTCQVTTAITGQIKHYQWNATKKKVEQVTADTKQLPSSSTIQSGTPYTLTDTNIYRNIPWSDILVPKEGKMKQGGDDVYIKSDRNPTVVDPYTTDGWDWQDYWMSSNLGAEFRRKKFKCKITDYHNSNGRVKAIEITGD